ncbi:hypothetical protein ALQ79_200710 [Pseudomonas amygdali pv. lachrymans]|nr:hypothetical protein ALQ79_200710 [Pseudomonas amygdali pv. lachrymans]
MTLKQLAVETARYHSRMAVRDIKYFQLHSGARAHRADRDKWMAIARTPSHSCLN